MRFLTARRRHPAAKGLVLVFALLVMGALYSAVAPSQKSAADTGTSQQVAEGKALFAVSCASCHGLNGEGQVSGTIQGPPLVGVGAAAVEFQVATGRMPMAHPGPQAQTKPSQFTEDEILALAAYVATPRPRPGHPRAGVVRPGRLSARRRSPAGVSSSGPTARPATTSKAPAARCRTASTPPALIGVSNLHLYEAMVTGPQQMPVFSNGVLTIEDKRAIIGYLNELHAQPNQRRPRPRRARPGEPRACGPGSSASAVLVLFAIWIAAKGVKAR